MSTAIRLMTPRRMLRKEDGLIFRSVRISYDGPRTLSFGHDIRVDEGFLSNGDKVSLTINGLTAFTGWIYDLDPTLGPQETIEYRAVGPRSRLATIIHTRNGSANVVYNAEGEDEESTSGWTYAQIFNDVISRVTNEAIASVSGIKAMNTVAPETTFNAMSVDNCLRYIVEKAGKFGFYITPGRKLIVVNLGTMTSKERYVRASSAIDTSP